MSEEQNPFTVGRAFLATQPPQQDAVPLLEFPSLEEYRKKARAELRDRFAMAALKGMVGHDHIPNLVDAKASWRWADLMLETREEDSQ